MDKKVILEIAINSKDEKQCSRKCKYISVFPMFHNCKLFNRQRMIDTDVEPLERCYECLYWGMDKK